MGFRWKQCDWLTVKSKGHFTQLEKLLQQAFGQHERLRPAREVHFGFPPSPFWGSILLPVCSTLPVPTQQQGLESTLLFLDLSALQREPVDRTWFRNAKYSRPKICGQLEVTREQADCCVRGFPNLCEKRPYGQVPEQK